MNICDFPEEILIQIFQLIECNDDPYLYHRKYKLYTLFISQICIISNLIMTCKQFSFLREMKYLMYFYHFHYKNDIYFVTDFLGYYGDGPSYMISDNKYYGYNSKHSGYANEHLIINDIKYYHWDLDNINRIEFFNELYGRIIDKELLLFLKDNMKSRKMLIARNFPIINITNEELHNLMNKYKFTN